MADRTVTLTLPDALYERLKETAAAASLSMEEVLTQSIVRSLPTLEDDLPADIRSELTTLTLMDDEALWAIAGQAMNEPHQHQLETLAEAQQCRSLTTPEQQTLARLMSTAHATMLRKAEAYRLLAQRGHIVFA